MPDWLKDAAFYEIYPQSFYDSNGDGIGDIPGIREKLDYIRWLGCNALWLNPCFDSPFRDAGYDVRDYKKVAPRYGTNDDLCELFRKAHEMGMHVLLDLVPGHTSEEHPWFRQSCLPEKNEFSNRYIWTGSVWDSPMEYHCISGRADRDGNYIVNFFSTQPALNYGFQKITADWQLPCTHPDCTATRLAMEDVMRFWLEKGCDGFRVDMAFSLVKNDDDKKSATGEIWRKVRGMLDRDYPQAALISEWGDPPLALGCGFHGDFYLNRKNNGCSALFRDRSEKDGRPLSYFSSEGGGHIRRFAAEYLPWYEKTSRQGHICFITGNHDTPRISRGLGTRELKLAYAFLFTMPGVPFLYYGDEIGMKYLEGLTSKEGGFDRTGSRTPMQWNASERNLGFSSAPAEELYLPVDPDPDAPTVNGQSSQEDSLLNTVRAILRLRQENCELRADGPFELLLAKDGGHPLIYRRGGLLLAVNPFAEETQAPVPSEGEVIFSIGGKTEQGRASIRLAAQSFAVIRQKP